MHKFFFILFIIPLSINAMEAPKTFHQEAINLDALPADLLRKIIYLSAKIAPQTLCIYTFETTICALNRTNKSLRRTINSPGNLLALFKYLRCPEAVINVANSRYIKKMPGISEKKVQDYLDFLNNGKVLFSEMEKIYYMRDTHTVKKIINENSKKTELNWNTTLGETPLSKAIDLGLSDVVENLIAAGVDVNFDENCMFGPNILKACKNYKNNNITILSLLLQANANPNIQYADGTTALMRSSDYGNIEHVKLLLEAGANPDLRDQFGKTAHIYAMERNRLEVAKLLEQASEAKKQSKPK